MGWFSKCTHNKVMREPGIALGLAAFSLLLLVIVLLSVPGPIKGLYWFSVAGEQSGEGNLSAGVLGWCATDTSNCTYAPLSDNKYLSGFIDTGEALTVRLMLPLACYWSLVVLVLWIILCVMAPIGYRIKDLDSITRHLRFAIIEACVLCVTLFGNVLTWLAFGLGRTAFMSVQAGGGRPKSGHAMETTAVAALMSLFSLILALWGLHLRLQNAQAGWKDEAVMVRRRSMALSAAGAAGLGLGAEIHGEKNGSRRWSEEPQAYYSKSVSNGSGAVRGSMVKDVGLGDEERLNAELAMAKRTSREQEMGVRRATMISPDDGPYTLAHEA